MDKAYRQLINGLVARGGMSWAVSFDDARRMILRPYKSTRLCSPDLWLVQHEHWKTLSYYVNDFCHSRFIDSIKEADRWFSRTPALYDPPIQHVLGYAKVGSVIEMDVSMVVNGKENALSYARKFGSNYIWNACHGPISTGSTSLNANAIVRHDPELGKKDRHVLVYEL